MYFLISFLVVSTLFARLCTTFVRKIKMTANLPPLLSNPLIHFKNPFNDQEEGKGGGGGGEEDVKEHFVPVHSR